MISIDERILHEELQRTLREQKVSGVTATFSAPAASLPVGTDLSRPPQGNDISGGRDKSVPTALRAVEDQPPFALDKGRSDKVQWEDYLIGLLLRNPGLHVRIYGIIDDGDFAGTDTRELYRIFNSVYQRDASPLFQSFEQFVPSALLETVARARKSVESRTPLEGAGLVNDAVQCATRLKRASLLQSNTELRYLERGATETGDVAAVQQFRRQLLDIHRQLRTIDSAMHLQG